LAPSKGDGKEKIEDKSVQTGIVRNEPELSTLKIRKHEKIFANSLSLA
jgi:hypothetical protein